MKTLEVQQILASLGFDPGPIDGIRGPKTDAAVVAFKRSIGLRARPFVGPITIAALQEAAERIQQDGSAYLAKEDLPWMEAAANVRGLHERRNNSALRDWFWRSVAWINPAEIAWCGAFVETCHRMASPRTETVENPLGARQWMKFGKEANPGFGATLVFWRGKRNGWQGHVGFYHGEDATHYHVLGGNQSNAVTVTRIAKTRLLGSRVPEWFEGTLRPNWVTPGGVPVTTNEA